MGAGTAVPTVRRLSESFLNWESGATIVRVNPNREPPSFRIGVHVARSSEESKTLAPEKELEFYEVDERALAGIELIQEALANEK